MATFIDLSIPVENGAGRLGLQVSFDTPYTFENCNWQGSTFEMFCHYATHVDAPVHFIKGGDTIEKVPLSSLMGPAGLIELDDRGASGAITSDILEERGRHVRRGDIAILRTGWSDKHWGSEVFWRNGPYLTGDAADWLVERGVKSVVYDFSEEYVVRQTGFRGEDCIVHHKILGHEIYNIEYVHALSRISRPRLAIMALPLKLVGVDGAPARVVALEGDDIPAEFQVA